MQNVRPFKNYLLLLQLSDILITQEHPFGKKNKYLSLHLFVSEHSDIVGSRLLYGYT